MTFILLIQKFQKLVNINHRCSPRVVVDALVEETFWQSPAICGPMSMQSPEYSFPDFVIKALFWYAEIRIAVEKAEMIRVHYTA